MDKKYLNIRELIQSAAQSQPNKKALIFLPRGEDEAEQLSYSELHYCASILAKKMQQADWVGATALLVYPSCLEYIVAFLACLYAGVIAVPVYPPRKNHHANRLKNIIEDANVNVILTLSSLKKTLPQQCETQRILTTDLLNDEENDAKPWYNPAINFTDIAYLQYTSGSTGSPKGVVVRHSDLLNQCAMYQRAAELNTGETHVSWLPIFHDMGLVQGIILPLYLSGTCVFMPPAMFVQRPIRWLKAIDKYRANMSGGPNFSYSHCIEKTTIEERSNLDLSCWTRAINGAEPILKKTLDDFSKMFTVCGFKTEHFCTGYGMAEATLMVTLAKPLQPTSILYLDKTALENGKAIIKNQQTDNTRATVSCGLIQQGANIIIVNPSTKKHCKNRDIGEVWISGTSVCESYWNNPKQTKETFLNTFSNQEECFLSSGDLGFIHEGQLYITGRLKDLIIIRGENHYPQDIEQTSQNAHKSLKKVNSAAAFTVTDNNIEQLVIVQEVERTQRNYINIDEVVQKITGDVVRTHSITPYEIVLTKPGTVPLTSSGKVQRQACRSLYLSGKIKSLSKQERLQQEKNYASASI